MGKIYRVEEMVHDIRRKAGKWLRTMRVVGGGVCAFLWGIGLDLQLALAQGGSVRHHATATANSRVVRGTPSKVFRYARRVIEKYDENQNGQLELNEWSQMEGEPQFVDSDSDGIITIDEFVAHVSDYGRHHNIRPVVPRLNPSAAHADHLMLEKVDAASQSTLLSDWQSTETRTTSPSKNRQKGIFYVPSSRLPGGLPSWFRLRDINGDGQVTVAEFSHSLDPAELREFSRYDLNRDGVLAPEECAHGTGKSSQKSKSSTSRSARPSASSARRPSASSARSSLRPTATAATKPNRPIPPSKYRSTKPTASSIERSSRYGTSSLDRPRETPIKKLTTRRQSAARETTTEHSSAADRLRPVHGTNGNKSGKVPRSSLNKSGKPSKSVAIKAEKEGRFAEARRNQKEDHPRKRKKSSADKSQKSASDKRKSRQRL